MNSILIILGKLKFNYYISKIRHICIITGNSLSFIKQISFSQESISKRNEVMFMPFGYGPRMCIGFLFAILELKIVLARLVKEFKFIKTAETPKQLEMVHRFAAVPKGDITLMVENR